MKQGSLTKAPLPTQKHNTTMANEVKTKMQDILCDIAIGRLCMRYFQKTPSWLYHKINQEVINGKQVTFTEEEVQQLKGALVDLSDRIRRTADAL